MSNNSLDAIDRMIGGRLKSCLDDAGLTIAQLAKHLAINVAAARMYESGKKRIPAQILLKICAFAKVPVEYFFVENPVHPSKYFFVSSVRSKPTAPRSVPEDALCEFLNLPEAAGLVSAFIALSDTEARSNAVSLIARMRPSGLPAADRSKKSSAGI